jgi:hypothetical protein
MVQALAQSYLQRSLFSFTRFLGMSSWTPHGLFRIALKRFFRVLRIKAHSVLFPSSMTQSTKKQRERSADVPGMRIMSNRCQCLLYYAEKYYWVFQKNA